MNPLEVNSHCGCLADIKHSLLIFIVLLKGWKFFLEIKITSAKKWRVGRFPFPDDQPVSESSCNSHCRWNAAKNDLRDNFKSWLHFRSHQDLTVRHDHYWSSSWCTKIPFVWILMESSYKTEEMDRYAMRWESSANCFIEFQREMKKDILFF